MVTLPTTSKTCMLFPDFSHCHPCSFRAYRDPIQTGVRFCFDYLTPGFCRCSPNVVVSWAARDFQQPTHRSGPNEVRANERGRFRSLWRLCLTRNGFVWHFRLLETHCRHDNLRTDERKRHSWLHRRSSQASAARSERTSRTQESVRSGGDIVPTWSGTYFTCDASWQFFAVIVFYFIFTSSAHARRSWTQPDIPVPSRTIQSLLV